MNKFFIITSLFFIFSCQSIKKEHVVQGEAQGTTYTVKYLSYKEQKGLKQQMDSLLLAFDFSVSTYRPQSLISQFNKSNRVQPDFTFEEVYRASKRIHAETDGAFDPTIGPVISAWGFGFENPQKLDSGKVDSLLTFCGFNLYHYEQEYLVKDSTSAQLNFNAIAQGYAVDLMGQLLGKKGLKDYYVELGGEILVKGKNKELKNWQIGIDQPLDENLDRELSHIIGLSNAAMATSGNYRKYYEIDGVKYAHTIDPKTGFPVQHSLLSASIVAEDCMSADAYATACMVMGVEKAKQFIDSQRSVEGILIFQNQKGELEAYISKGLKNQVQSL